MAELLPEPGLSFVPDHQHGACPELAPFFFFSGGLPFYSPPSYIPVACISLGLSFQPTLHSSHTRLLAALLVFHDRFCGDGDDSGVVLFRRCVRAWGG